MMILRHGTPEASAPGGAAAGPAVLLVEDNPVNREVGVAILEQLGCEVAVAHDGAEALTRWRGACSPRVGRATGTRR
jgi:PleD family two-component response regulator